MDGETAIDRLRLMLPGDGPGSNRHETLDVSHRMSVAELAEFATGLQAVAALAADLFKIRPPEGVSKDGKEEEAKPQATEQRVPV